MHSRTSVPHSFAVKPMKTFFLTTFSRHNQVSLPIFSAAKMGSYLFWYWWLGIVFGNSHDKQKRFEKAHHSLAKIFWKWSKHVWKKQLQTKPISHISIAQLLSVWGIENISQKSFLQCFTCRRTLSRWRVIAEKTLSKTIYRLLRSLLGLHILLFVDPILKKQFPSKT